MNVINEKVRTGLLGFVAVLSCWLLAAAAQAAPYAALVMDGRTGQVIHAENADTPLHPASLTKMMTLYLAFAAVEQGRIRLDSPITITNHAASMPPSKLGLRPGQKIELRFLIRAAAIKSANDAATAIAEGLAGSEPKFAAQMTSTARALGMRNTQFRNANGLTAEGHYSSARDLTVLGRHLFYDFPQYYNLFSRRSADAGVAKVISTNARFLDSYEGADGIKTGYTRAAGFNLTASAQRGQKRIIATVMGGNSTADRNQRMAQLLDAGFKKAPTRVAEVRPRAVLAKQPVVRQAKATPPPATVAAAPPPPQVVSLNLSDALREAMASRPDPAPTRSAAAPAAAASTANVVAMASRPATPPTPTAAAASRDDAVRDALAESLRPSARPEGSAPETAPSTAVSFVAEAPAQKPGRPPRR